MSTIPTVKVKRDGPKGYRLINASDFNPDIHELADATARDEAAMADKHVRKRSAKA